MGKRLATYTGYRTLRADGMVFPLLGTKLDCDVFDPFLRPATPEEQTASPNAADAAVNGGSSVKVDVAWESGWTPER